MAKTDGHTVVIERRGRSHQSHCHCGWSGTLRTARRLLEETLATEDALS